MTRAPRKYVLDTNCFIDAARDPSANAAFETFCGHASPVLYLSAVVAAEVCAGAGRSRSRLERVVLEPYVRRGRVVAPSARSWEALGDTLATLSARHGLARADVSRSFVCDILIAHSCREASAILVSANTRDMDRIARVFAFDYVEPDPS